MSLKTPTLPEKLKKLGYSTHMIGKYVFKVWRESLVWLKDIFNVYCQLIFIRDEFILRDNGDILVLANKIEFAAKKNRENKVIAYLGRKFFIARK